MVLIRDFLIIIIMNEDKFESVKIFHKLKW